MDGTKRWMTGTAMAKPGSGAPTFKYVVPSVSGFGHRHGACLTTDAINGGTGRPKGLRGGPG